MPLGVAHEVRVTALIFVAIWLATIFAGFAIPQLFDRDVVGAAMSGIFMVVGLVAGPIIAFVILRFGFGKL